MTAAQQLHYRIRVDQDLIDNIREELDRTSREIAENKTPLTPTRRNTIIACLELMQGPECL